ncbi:phosphatidylinositol 4-kinase gamma 5 [Canna indica]|uniref:1-phosphatidylinositol 4-kinase n=1 Tax=Canna indica TaxID=4628 RepID=A0AAQ3L1T0_9LILI|nr:phosphatidylinositol 4-kinase gamma 5 [Canna indica]
MSPNLDSPVQTQMAVAVLNHTASSDLYDKKISEATPVGRRRVFVQTETGCVLGLDLDRQDNAHTVKRKLQIALNFPTEESSLTFGDLVLKNDLSAVRRDSPLLLTRNSMHKSSSTPCLSLSMKDLQQRDHSGPIEIVGCSNHCARIKQLVKDVVEGINSGIDPTPVHNGLGGAYYFRNNKGDKVAIVKPTDEEPFAPNNPKGFVGKALGQPGLKRSVRVGETGFREVAAYLLDYDNFANVPPTALVKITHSMFHVNDGMNNNSSARNCGRMQQIMSKIASFQQFIPHDFDASDHGTSSFPVAAIHRIGILDIRILNTDRHAGNLLVRKLENGVGRFGARMELIPIDHGLCLPESLEDPYFEWIHWPQASVPFSEEELEYIANLDPLKDSDMLRRELPMIREACLRVLILCTIFLKEAAAFGLCLAEIGEMMSREFSGMDEAPSELEVICMDARKSIAEREVFCPKDDLEEEQDFQFHMECTEDNQHMMYNSLQPFNFGLSQGSSRNILTKLEGIEEDAENDEEYKESSMVDNNGFSHVHEKHPLVTKLSSSLKGVSLTGKTLRNQVGSYNKDTITSKANDIECGGIQSGNSRSADEKLPSAASFVKLADMGEEEWGAFLDNFQELLQCALCNRKSTAAGQRQKQRLGTSCQF